MRLLAVCLLIACVLPVHAAEGDVPEAIQGRWADSGGACDASGAPIVISATTVVNSDGTISDLVFTPDDSMLRIREEAAAYEYVAEDDILLFRPEGFGMGSAFPMVRCADPVASDRRCGWLAHLAPGDWTLVDGERVWILSAPADGNGETLAVMDRVPAFDLEQYVDIDGTHGFGCACMTVATDAAEGRITAIASSQRLSLATCEADETLPSIEGW